MNKLHVTPRRRVVIIAALVLIVGGAFLAPRVFGKVIANTIDTTAFVSRDGSQILVRGPITGTAGERCDLRATVTQRSTGAIAEGGVHLRLNGSNQTWVLEAEIVGDAAFVPGPATVVAAAVTSKRGDATDAHQWLVNVTLVRE
jgi:hypothetical protein